MSRSYFLAFWNLENLFDVADSPRRSEKVRRAIGKDVMGWTQSILDRKITQLASIIAQMNDRRGPDLLGVCEVENEYVLRLLADAPALSHRRYKIVHFDTADRRGIDTAFLYDGELFHAEKVFSHFVMRRTATRDLLQVNFHTAAGRVLVVIANHWPSRSGGRLESEPYRMIAGETLAYYHQRILEVLGNETAVAAMGDFNDEPSDRSLQDYALSTRSSLKVSNARRPSFFNLMWPLMGKGEGSFFFDNSPFLFDQFLCNRPLLTKKSSLRVIDDSVEIVKFPEMLSDGEYPKPLPFGGMGKPVNLNGFSDHFPISVRIMEK